MSWMAKLYETYEAGMQLDLPESDQLMPISHTRQAAHLNVVINGDGEFIRIELLDKPQLVIPATEKSAGRTRGIEAHGLSDKIQYIASDYIEKGGKKDYGYTKYIEQLTDWADFAPNLKKLHAILKYIRAGSFIEDLYSSSVLPELKASFLYLKHKNKIGFLDKDRTEPVKVEFVDIPDMFKLITQKKDIGEIHKQNLSCNDEIELEEKYKITEIDIGSLLVCWTVEIPNVNPSATWLDKELQDSWIKFVASKAAVKGLCLISGEKDKVLSTNFPANIRRPGDKAKIISTNDFDGFTFKGKFTDTKESIKKRGQQSFGVGLIETQKAHNALSWLISRQGFRNGDQAIVAWAVSGSEIPQPMEDIWDLLGEELQEMSAPLVTKENQVNHTIDLGQSFSKALSKYMAGYQAKFKATDSVIIMGVDSTNGFKGRMAVTYYQEFFPEEYIKRISQWHEEFSWPQRHNFKKDEESQDGKSQVEFPSAPSPRAIWAAAYGKQITDSLKKSTVERILPCIVEARPFPRDLVNKVVQRAGNRSVKRLSDQYSNWKSEKAAWEKDLSVACALFRGFSKRNPNQTKEYGMALEENRTTRDYLYGRLLAIAEKIEEMAMIVAKEKVRTTHASRLMQRFSDHPASTWLTIEKGINPYQQRLRNNIPPLESAYKRLLDDICDAFENDDFVSLDKLSAEYLLGYHCQRKWLIDHKLKAGKWVIKETGENDEFQTEGDEE